MAYSSRQREAVRRRMVEAGDYIWVVCTRCLATGKHVVGGPKRLRDKRCSRCGGRARPLWWKRKYSARFEAEHAAAVKELRLR